MVRNYQSEPRHRLDKCGLNGCGLTGRRSAGLRMDEMRGNCGLWLQQFLCIAVYDSGRNHRVPPESICTA